ncbi:hypothetical protein ILUMI_15748, partial [Ignelater luminosus]
KAILNYGLSHAEGDKLPYLKVAIFENSFLDLLDSGASHTILGQSGLNKLKHLSTLGDAKRTTCAVGSTCHSIGAITVPICPRDKTKLLDVLVVTSVPDSLILVPQCTNTSIKTPEKMFVSIPKNTKIRKKWLMLARRNPKDIAASTNAFMCEDHFN